MTEETHVQGPTIRPRRLRRTPALRRMVAETHVVPSSLVLPVLIASRTGAGGGVARTVR